MKQCLLSVVCLLIYGWIVNGYQYVNWGICPPSQTTSSYSMQCANLTFPLNRDDISMGNVTAFVRRAYVSTPTDNSIWLIAGGPGDSTRTLGMGTCDFFLSSDATFTCYTQDARGTGLSSYMSCGNDQPSGPFNPHNQTQLNRYDDCFKKIMNDYGNILQYYSTYSAAQDLLGSIQAINPSTVHIYAQSYGTYALNTYMQLPGARADVIVLDGPVPPNRWSLENNAEWVSQVAQDILYGCVVNSSVCSDRLSRMAHIPRLVMDAIIDGTLPCLRNISWLNDTSGQFWASIYTNACTGGSDRATSHITEGPFWYRLHRCSASDVEQLNFFNNYEQVALYYSPPPEDYSLGVAINIATSEVYSYSKTPLDYTMQVQRSARLLGSSGVEMMVAYARNVTEFPIYEVNPSVYMKFFKPSVPVLILVGTYDANTENGLGAWYQEGLGPMSTLLNVPYNSHVTFSYDNPCVNGIILEFFESLGTSYDDSCLQYIPNPNWDGSSQISQDYSYQLFGTYDLWNDDFAIDEPANATCTILVVSSNDDDNSCNDMNIAAIVAGIVVPLSLIIIGLVAYIVILKRATQANSLTTPLTKSMHVVELQ